MQTEQKWFIPSELSDSADIETITQIIENTIKKQPERKDDYVLVDVVDEKLVIEFLPKEQIEKLKKEENKDTHTVIMDIMRWNNSEEGKLYNKNFHKNTEKYED